MDADVIRRFKAREKAQRMWRSEMGCSDRCEAVVERIIDELVDEYEGLLSASAS
jgi:hypothetical protein